ncbi:MAG: isocitrate lyase/phosphoenolpyruvate mutase family protein [Acidisphaera sp.]|nr:isocitrate lyase/phosphoenolpyruvate mutase family protein [Acidisphaera sp.]MBV9813836.1 isocitrate lyase/phosphoenolpyruvate mutase family protein [Acetobacteraceae bacterium]
MSAGRRRRARRKRGPRGVSGAQSAAYERFKALHAGPAAFVMPNAWDGASAVLLKEAGFSALGTTSYGIALALGRRDGEHGVSLADAVANGQLLTRLTGLPVNGDLEDGFGPEPEHCVATVEAAVAGGLAGLGIEDTTADPARPIHDFDAAVERIRAACRAARGRILLTARTDNFLHGRADLHDTVRRLTAFAEAGADVLYAPGLPDMDAIRTVVRAVAPRPVNVLIGPATGAVPLADLTAAGVRRVSLGGALYRRAMQGLRDAARQLAAGDLAAGSTAMPGSDIARLLPA